MEVLTTLNTPVQGWRFDGRHQGAGPGLEAATDTAPHTVVSERRGQNSTCNAYRFPDIFPETPARNLPKMRSAQKRSLSAYRRRLKRQGMIRVEVQVRKDDAALLRGIAKALTDPAREAETRALLRERFGVVDAIGLKALLAAAPLEGIDLTRDRDLDRDVIV